ncbi:MAG: cyclopropane-fatty-acyl-phospholipid synthase family protein [Duganella sp.]
MTTTLSNPSLAPPEGARMFLRLLAQMRHGHLEMITPDHTRMVFGDAHSTLGATLQVHDWRACQRILRAGDIGFAEAWAAGWVDTPDLTALLRLALRNEAALDQMLFGGALARCWYRLRHWLRPNSRKGSERNIHAHYDIGNDFYQLWLDPSWTYSSAIFDGDYSTPLEQAQQRKYQRIIDTLQLRPGQRVLEIGCGWGGFAVHAAQQGIAVHGVTISPSQLAVARARTSAMGLDNLAQLELCDYRDLSGQYDAVVSIEMFEAVGERYWPEYFSTVAARLAPGGQALVQSITIGEQFFPRYRSSADFIQQYIFPGGMLPSVERFEQHAARAGLQTQDRYAFGRDYAETLRRWDAACRNERPAIDQLGYDQAFMRIWHMYFAYCEAAFDEGRTDVVQFLLRKD